MKVKICKTLISQIRGLMFSRKKNLVFVYDKPTLVDLHMLFVFFPIDALYINDGRIVEIKHMKPFRGTYKAKHYATSVVELSEKHSFSVGNKVIIKENEFYKVEK